VNLAVPTFHERRHDRSALHESEGWLRRVLKMLPEPMIVHTGGRIGFVNEAAQRLFGRQESELVGCAPLALLHPGSVDEVAEWHAKLVAGAHVPPTIEARVLRADGATRVVETTTVVVAGGAQHAMLWLMRDITELAQARAEVARSHDDLRRLVAAQGRVQEGERQRIARELHDDLQQRLAAIRIDLGALRSLIVSDPARALEMLPAIEHHAGEAIVSSHRIVNDLRPQILDDLGLQPALESLARQFGQRMGIDCSVGSSFDADSADVLSSDGATCLYRVAQEALNNVAKHSGARTVEIRLDVDAAGRIVMEVCDDGVGLQPGDRRKQGSFGLLGMDERVRSLGGSLAIDARDGRGVRITARLPVGAVPVPHEEPFEAPEPAYTFSSAQGSLFGEEPASEGGGTFVRDVTGPA
jgi:PAS domain S-box-containing protein